MSCTGEDTKLSCGGYNYPFTATNLEPIKYNYMETTWGTDGGETVPIQRCFYIRDPDGGLTLQFRHTMTYDGAGNEVSILID